MTGKVGTSVIEEAAATAVALPDVSASLGAANQAILTALINANTPVGTAPNVVYSATGASIPAAQSGVLNALVITAPVTGSNIPGPSGYLIQYLIGGSATLQAPHIAVEAAAADTVEFRNGATLIGGSGFNTFKSDNNGDASNHVYGGIGQNLFMGSEDIIASQGTDTLVGGASTISASGSLLVFGGDNNLTTTGTCTLVGYSGTLSLAGASSALAFDSGDTLVQAGSGSSTIVGSGPDSSTIQGGSGAILDFESDFLHYKGGSAVDTIVGASATATIGTAGALIFGDGPDTIVSTSGGPLTYIGYQSAAVTLGGSASNLVALASGNVDASGSTGSNTFFDNGSVSIAGGSGATAIVAGSGNSTLNPGSGETLILIGEVNNTGRTFSVGNFDGSHDFINLVGYAPGANAAAFASETFANTASGVDTTIKLLDGTRIVFHNAANLAAFSFT